MAQEYKIADWLVHGGHQYEFFKTNKYFVCSNPNGTRPSPQMLGRPRNKSVKYVDANGLMRSSFNIIMVRAGVDYRKLEKRARGRNIPGIAVMQTHLPFDVPSWVRCVVWNSENVMLRHKSSLPKRKHFYIPHGFDPKEFCSLDIRRNGRVLSAASLFEKRRKVMGYDEWRWVANELKLCDLLGHGNEGIKESIGSFPLKQLVKLYNSYSIFLNTTTRSAMPRVRAEALMCGTPLVTTKNFGIEKYLTHNKNCLYADSKEDMLRFSKRLLESSSMQADLGQAGREVAIKYFNIDDYKSRWEEVFYEAIK